MHQIILVVWLVQASVDPVFYRQHVPPLRPLTDQGLLCQFDPWPNLDI